MRGSIRKMPYFNPLTLALSRRANPLKFLGEQYLTAEVIIPGGLQALLPPLEGES
jgi:hypothetical protein